MSSRIGILRLLDRFEELIISFLMAGATLVIFIAVTHRYAFKLMVWLLNWSRSHEIGWLLDFSRDAIRTLNGINLTWAQELCIIMFVWMAKFGAAYGVRTGVHVGVDVLINRLKGPSKGRVIVFGLLCGALFTFTVGSFGAQLVWKLAHTQQVSPDMEAPMWLVYLAVPAGSYLMCFRFLQVAAAFVRTGELPHHDQTQVAGLDQEPDFGRAAAQIAPAGGGAR